MQKEAKNKMFNMIPKNIDFMGILRQISNSPNPGALFQQALQQYPQLQMFIQTWQNSQDPNALLKQFFGNTPQYQQIMQNIEGKNQAQILDFLRNRYKEQGINFDNLINLGSQLGIVK